MDTSQDENDKTVMYTIRVLKYLGPLLYIGHIFGCLFFCALPCPSALSCRPAFFLVFVDVVSADVGGMVDQVVVVAVADFAVSAAFVLKRHREGTKQSFFGSSRLPGSVLWLLVQS